MRSTRGAAEELASPESGPRAAAASESSRAMKRVNVSAVVAGRQSNNVTICTIKNAKLRWALHFGVVLSCVRRLEAAI